jgi:hypothetical protein
MNLAVSPSEGGTTGQREATEAQRQKGWRGRMMVHSRTAESVALMVAVVVGMPLVGMLFLAVLYYCCLEWLHDALMPRESMPTRRIRAIGANL